MAAQSQHTLGQPWTRLYWRVRTMARWMGGFLNGVAVGGREVMSFREVFGIEVISGITEGLEGGIN